MYASPDPHTGNISFYYLFIFTIYFLFYTITEKTDPSVLMLHHLCNMFLENYEAKNPFKLTILRYNNILRKLNFRKGVQFSSNNYKIEYRYGYKFGRKQQNVIENDDVKRTN